MDGNWILDATIAITSDLFQLKLISEMFEMFVLLINSKILTASNAMVF